MNLYCAVIRPILSFSSQLQSDTFFGAFCWSYRYCCGEERLMALLKDMEEGHPAVIFSNAFPKGTFPLPLGIHDSAADFETIESKVERRHAYQEHKKLKNARFVRREWFKQIADGNCCGFAKGLEEEGIQGQTVIHNLVTRDTGTVRNVEGSGNLYEEDVFYIKEDQEYELYILSSLDEKRLRQIVEMMLLLGIGKNKSTGKGAFELKGWKEADEIGTKKKSNAFMALSNFIPASADPIKGYYKTLVKYGKMDREYAASDIPFKKPLLFLQAGAVFFDEPVKEYYGSCVCNVSVRSGVVTNAYTIPVPLYIKL